MASVALRRYDILARPESFRADADGCIVASHCQDCPLPECRPGTEGLRLLQAMRVRAAYDGHNAAIIALQEGLTTRSVYRILARG